MSRLPLRRLSNWQLTEMLRQGLEVGAVNAELDRRRRAAHQHSLRQRKTAAVKNAGRR